MNKKKCGLVVVAVGLFVMSLVADEVLYKDDFKNRTSSLALPASDISYAMKYIFCSDAGTTRYLGNNFLAPFEIDEDNFERYYPTTIWGGFDAWIKSINSTDMRFYVPVATATAGNPCGALVNPNQEGTSNFQGQYRQHLFNTFTTGFLDVSIDMRSPDTLKNNHASACMYFVLGDDYYASPYFAEQQTFYSHAAAAFGLGRNGSTTGSAVQLYVQKGNGSGSGSSRVLSGQNTLLGTWFRFKVQLDLNNETFTVRAFNLEDADNKPTFETATTDEIEVANNKWTDLPFRIPPSSSQCNTRCVALC